ncbi:hypothetical protein K4K57_004937 [Colletotrichum sp. SAR 10_99]|nr:hypothetical protein K4K55_004937 [Colletotrichum sp. SAR 10_96]KAJ5011949.1 hypothetical protein K4K57_004937 [Colletotrichum sp. SAR 10_99]
MGRHLLMPNTPVHLAEYHDHDPQTDWPADAPLRSTFRVNQLVTSKRNRRMATDYSLRARQLLRYAAADPAQPHADTITNEHVRRARFLQPLYDPAADEEEDEERWPAQWAESVKSLRGFVTCRPWKEATEGYLAIVEEEKEDKAGEKDVAAAEDQEQPPAEPAPGPQQSDNEAAQAAADLLNLSDLGSILNLSGMGTVPPQTTPVKPAAPAPRAFPDFGETQDTPAALFSTSPHMFGPGSRERNRANGRGRSRSVSPKGGNNPVIGGGFTEEEMERFRAWVAREERKKAREAGGN